MDTFEQTTNKNIGSQKTEGETFASRDAMIKSFFGNSGWVYDIATDTMEYDYLSSQDGNGSVCKELSDYCNSIKDMRLIHEDDIPIFDVFCAEMAAGKEHITAEYRAVAEDYQIKWFRQMAHTVYDEEGKPVKVYGRRFDITREKEKDTNVSRELTQDALTGLYNREKIRELINENFAKDDGLQKAIILIDVDRFKEINDSFGKMYGDIVLQTISGVIYTNFMSKDLVGRIAGDQFIVFCDDISKEKVHELVEQLRQRLPVNVPIRDERQVSVSAGIAFYPDNGREFDLLYSRADIALLKAKKAGGDCYLDFDYPSMKEIFAGYTYMKMGSFDEDESRQVKSNSKINKKLFDFAFDTLSKENDIKEAVGQIFEEVGLHYGIDRAILHERDDASDLIDISVYWEKDNKSITSSQNVINTYIWEQLEKEQDEEGYLIFEDGRSQTLDFFREIVQLKNPPVSAILFSIMDSSSMAGLISFETYEEHVFKANEIATLKSIVHLISSYLLGHMVKQQLEAEAIINRNVMDSQKIVYYIIDRDTYEVKYVSKAAKEVFKKMSYGRKCYECIDNPEPCACCPVLKDLSAENTTEFYDDYLDKWYTLTATPMKYTNKDKDVLVCVSDVTEFLYKVKGEDSLTVADSFDKFIVGATKSLMKKDDQFTIVCAGIHEFSKINDEYGYVVGDEVLKEFAKIMKRDLKEGELLCRIKGDDFVLLKKKADDALKDYFKICSGLLTDEFRKTNPNIEINCFAGQYLISDEDEYVNQCVDNAMKARAVASQDISKQGGFYTYSHEFVIKEQEEAALQKKMKQALSTGGFKVYFQPKVDVDDGSIIGAEALVRMQDSDGKMVSPGLFIPLAEKTGMVVDIDTYVYEQTFAYMHKWLEEGKKIPLVSVNVSRLHLLNDELPNRMKALSEKYELKPSQIELEITESVFFEDTERLIEMIKRLKDIGFVISMDDFGSGYSTLNFMKELPVDVIKIDGGFFMKNEMDKKSKAIISAIIQLTKNLEFTTVSEGVETEEQVQFIREQGGTCVQGYFFYKPMPAEEFEKLL